MLLAEPRRIRFTALPPGEDFDFDSHLNRFGVVVVVVVLVVVVVVVDGRSLDEEAIERLPLRTDREVVVFRLLTDGLEPPKEDRCVLGLRAFKRKMSSPSPRARITPMRFLSLRQSFVNK